MKENPVKFLKYLAVFSVMMSLTVFVVGCGDSSGVSPEDDEVLLDPESDPTLDVGDESCGEVTD